MQTLEMVIKANADGLYSAKEVINQIIAQFPTIQTPEDKSIEEVALNELTLEDSKCYYGSAEGVTESWSNDNMEYLKRKFTLYFE